MLLDLILYQQKFYDVELLILSRKNVSNGTFAAKAESICKVHYSEFSKFDMRHIFFIIKIFKNNYNLIHSHLFPTQLFVVVAKKLSNTQILLITTEHNTENKRRKYPLLQLADYAMYSAYDSVICISQAVRDTMLKWLKYSKNEKLVVVSNGVDIAKYQKVAYEKAPLIKYVIVVGRLEPQKDIATVLKAFSLIQSAQIKLRIVGDGIDRSTLEGLSESLGLAGKVEFLGFRTDVRELLASSYLAIQSSYFEGFGLAAVEAMSSGLPVIASDVPGLNDVVGEFGLLFTLGDFTSLAEKIQYLCNDFQEWGKYSSLSLLRAGNFSIEQTGEGYSTIYWRLLYDNFQERS